MSTKNSEAAGAAASRPRLLFINRSYWPDVEASGQLLTELCEDLADEFDVHVISGQPNHNADRAAYRRSGIEEHNGVTIHRVAHTQFQKGSLAGRAINLLTFLLRAAWTAQFAPRPDVVVTETDPFLLPILGRWLKWTRGTKLVAYLQDLYPDVAVALDKVREGWLTWSIRRQLDQAYHAADAVVVLGEAMHQAIVNRGLDSRRICCITNWADTDQIVPIKESNPWRSRLAEPGQFLVAYSGNHGLSQQLGQVLDAAALLRDRPEVRFAFIGDGASKAALQRQAEAAGLNNVRFSPYVSKTELAASLSAADLQLLPLDPRVDRCLVPCKLYGILASGTPTIAVVSERSDVARVVRDNRVGMVVPPDSPDLLAETILWYADHPDEVAAAGRRARALAISQFDRRRSTTQFADLLRMVLGSSATNEAVEEVKPDTPPEMSVAHHVTLMESP